jgi:hypothetical protein
LEASIQCEGFEDFKIVVVILRETGHTIQYVACEGRTPLLDKTFPIMETIWQLSLGDEMSIPALKINILWDMADSIPYLVPTQLQELILPSPRPKYRL